MSVKPLFTLEYLVENGRCDVFVMFDGARRRIGSFTDRDIARTVMAQWEASTSGWIYFVRENRLVFIGRTVLSPIRSFVRLQAGNPRPLKLEHVLAADRNILKRIEDGMQAYWSKQRVSRAWFRIEPDELEEFLRGREHLAILKGERVPSRDTKTITDVAASTPGGPLSYGDPDFAQKYVESLAKSSRPENEALSPLSQEDLDALDDKKP